MTKDLFLGGMSLTGAFSVLRMLHRDKAVIAMYHRFGANDAPRTSTEVLAVQLEYLTCHYPVVRLVRDLLSQDDARLLRPASVRQPGFSVP